MAGAQCGLYPDKPHKAVCSGQSLNVSQKLPGAEVVWRPALGGEGGDMGTLAEERLTGRWRMEGGVLSTVCRPNTYK